MDNHYVPQTNSCRHPRRSKTRSHKRAPYPRSRSPSYSRSSSSLRSSSSPISRHRRHRSRHHSDRHHRYDPHRHHRRRKPYRRSRSHRRHSHGYSPNQSPVRHDRRRRRRRRRRRSWSISTGSCASFPADAAATEIQRIFRGSLVRKRVSMGMGLEGAVLSKVVEEIIEDVLLGEEIPNMLIEVLTNKTNEYEAFPEDEQKAFEICHCILAKVTEEESRRVVGEYLHEFVHDYLATAAGKSQAHPLLTLSNGIVEDVLARLHVEIVKAAIAEMVNEYLFLHSFEEFLYQTLQPVITSVVVEANEDLAMEREEDDIREDVIAELAFGVAEETLREMEKEVDRRQKVFMVKELATLSQTIIDYMLLEELMKAVANQGESVAMRECFEEVEMIHVGKALLAMVASKEKAQRDMVANRPLRMIHQLVSASAIFQPMLVQFENEIQAEAEEADELERDS